MNAISQCLKTNSREAPSGYQWSEALSVAAVISHEENERVVELACPFWMLHNVADVLVEDVDQSA
ncbi:MAG: hypothetical protein PW789_13095 [Edaphobacter sp.]|uniref:hypothetical protein n=1 Tax=Edaphobacter sp. TaxID=1934404 RepID=UPI0023910253|nr:hypothetical protein [Edaphobacter sp.]MDE1177520.1 hypothetical protein [Edaphobacter sp.]